MAIIETADPVLVDCHLEADGAHKALYHSIAAKTWASGMDKANISNELFNSIISDLEAVPFTPGGSTFNTLHTIQRTFASNTHEIWHYAAVGSDKYGLFLQQYCKQSGYSLRPNFTEQTRSLIDTPRSLVFNFSEHRGERKIATYRGNVRDFITAQTITPQSSDIIFLNGNGLSNYTGAFGALKTKAQRTKSSIIFSLPTRARVAQENFQECHQIALISNIILCNIEELAYLYPKNTVEEQLLELQRTLQTPKNSRNHFIPCALITCGENGAYIVTEDIVSHIAIWNKQAKIVSKVGCGDSAYAGFISGLLSGMNPVQSGHMGMAFAADCISHFEAQIPDPMTIFAAARTDIRITSV